MFQLGDKVKWTSQSNGSMKEKHGEIYAVVPAGKSVREHMAGILDHLWKFDTIYAEHDRYVVAVLRGGKSQKVDYYCPRPSLLQKNEEEKH